MSLVIWSSLLSGPAAGAVPANHSTQTSNVVDAGKTAGWIGPDGESLPFTSDDQVKAFLETATVLESERISEGITGAQKVMLETDGVRMRAIFRTIDVRKKGFQRSSRIPLRDYHAHECAAYELSRMLGLGTVPPAVLREIGSEEGTLQIWVENAMMDKERVEMGLEPPDSEDWTKQRSLMSVFDNLIYNTDRHLGNILVDRDWRVWLIDHTRAFRTYPQLRTKSQLTHCERTLWEALAELDKQELKEKLSAFLTKEQIRTIEKRRQKLIEHFEKLIEERGIDDVILN
jgi:hypothetical protein